jgi:PKHD-type hydroxylase
MNLKWGYWAFQSALSKKFCDDVMQFGKSLEGTHLQPAITGGTLDKWKDLSEEQRKNVQNKRKSEVIWLQEQWIYNTVLPYIHEANHQAGWNFQWDWSEVCQFTKYSEGQFYGWHCDSHSEPFTEEKGKNCVGKIRKLSATISLTDPNQYEGGNLEFDFRNQVDWENDKESAMKECTEIRPRGSIVVFPSFMWHRVKPVTKGTRYSLVLWNIGDPWK